MTKHSWADEHDKMLRWCIEVALLSFREAAGAINAAFNTGFTKEAAIGRAWRLKIKSKRRPGENGPEMTKRRKQIRGPRKASPKPRPTSQPLSAAVTCEAVPQGVSLLECTGCRWPFGDGPFTFCNQPQWPSSSYCEHHTAMSIGIGTSGEKRATSISTRWA